MNRLLTRLIDAENGLALRSEQVRVRTAELGFDYEIKAFFSARMLFLLAILRSSFCRSREDARRLMRTC